MTPERKWEIVHQYRRTVSRGLMDPILCEFDSEELVPVVSKDDNSPALRCLRCRSTKTLGLNDLERLEKQLWNS